MSKISLGTVLDKRTAKHTELESIFGAILTGVNTNKISEEQIRDGSVMRRHTKKPPVIYIRKKVVGTPIFVGSLNKTASWNWTTAVLTHDPTLGSSDGAPLAIVRAKYVSHQWQANSYEIGIGYSTDGSTYTLFPGSNRYLGFRNSYDKPLYTSKVADPNTGSAASYWPPAVYGHSEAETDVALVNVAGGPIVNNIVKLALGIRINHSSGAGNGTHNEHELDVAEIYLVGKDAS